MVKSGKVVFNTSPIIFLTKLEYLEKTESDIEALRELGRV